METAAIRRRPRSRSWDRELSDGSRVVTSVEHDTFVGETLLDALEGLPPRKLPAHGLSVCAHSYRRTLGLGHRLPVLERRLVGRVVLECVGDPAVPECRETVRHARAGDLVVRAAECLNLSDPADAFVVSVCMMRRVFELAGELDEEEEEEDSDGAKRGGGRSVFVGVDMVPRDASSVWQMNLYGMLGFQVDESVPLRDGAVRCLYRWRRKDAEDVANETLSIVSSSSAGSMSSGSDDDDEDY